MIRFSLEEIDKVVWEVLAKIPRCSIFTLEGPLGVGKTTLVKALLKECGVVQDVTSPTFAYVKTYEAEGREFNHFDLYRLNIAEEFVDLGFIEYLYSENAINLIEWPAVIRGLLSSDDLKGQVCNLKLQYDPNNPNVREIYFI